MKNRIFRENWTQLSTTTHNFKLSTQVKSTYLYYLVTNYRWTYLGTLTQLLRITLLSAASALTAS